MSYKKLFLLIILFLCCNISSNCISYSETIQIKKTEIKLTSTAFKDGEMIPEEYTCDDKNVSPPLSWTYVPNGTKSITIICDDPDAPIGIWVHWVLYDLPFSIKELTENIPSLEKLQNGAKHGINDFHKFGYGGPCPPGGTHRYYFKIYALDNETGLKPGATKEQLLKVIKGHILAEGQLIGRYKR